MAQERIDDFIQLAKDYAKAEKELEVQHWVFISIDAITNACSVTIYPVRCTSAGGG